MHFARIVRTAKEVVRHLVHRTGYSRRLDYLEPPERADRFAKIYHDGVWRHGDGAVPGSGNGSTLDATQNLRNSLPQLLDRLGSEKLLDIGCGDFTWMRVTPLSQSYIGADIVREVIERNQREFGSDRRRFIIADAVTDPLPAADTVLCREMLFHLSFDDIQAVLKNITSVDRRYVIMTNDFGTLFNSDIASGDFRLLNFRLRPFHLPKPLEVIDDAAVARGRVLAVWRAGDIRGALGMGPLARN